MVTDYDEGDTAELYRRAKNTLPIFQVDTYSLMQRIGDVSGLAVLDVACGDGHFTRLLRRAGAARVVGLDVSEEMIRLAREQEAADPLGIDYVVEDARRVIDPAQQFDLAAAAFLLVYARSRAELAEMCRGLASRVRTGGRFVTITVNPDLYHFGPAPDYGRYGLGLRLADHVYEGAPINFTLRLPDAELEIENYYLPVEAYRSELQSAGFTDVGVYGPALPPDAGADHEPGFWDELLARPVFVLLDCVKA
ncbi:class I SAM-dependent methyltransferase [Mycobacterium sp. Y57]|uniref:class I SAM-dependent methyltransferase n=1 Tax=Mycolicibacterium xanthum TaxID=2796469 RepID=UPI001C851213|nr:class I SAM-dependent methyltransferase [Mycolicibacterium xanthum]MBX7432647.1 class I SAM-dependent methyltransferase [Mycolicibacterium xanthum]